MTDSCENVKQKLDFFISEMAQNRWLFVNNPQSDFSRQDTGKLSFEDTLRLIIGKNNRVRNW